MSENLRDWVRFTIILVGVAIPVNALAAASGGAKDEIDVSAVLNREVGALEITVKNGSSASVALPRSSIPWLCSRSVVILIDSLGADQSAQRDPTGTSSSGDCPEGAETIPAESQLSGRVDIRGRFEDYEVLVARGMVVFWFWRLDSLQGRDPMDFGGALVAQDPLEDVPSSTSRVSVRAHDGARPGVPLDFAVLNVGDKQLSIRFGDLPWFTNTGLILRAVALNSSKELPGLEKFRDMLTEAWATMPARSFVFGELPLYSHVVGIERELEQHDVVVFWLYQGRTIEGERLDPQGGFVALSKRKPLTGTAATHRASTRE